MPNFENFLANKMVLVTGTGFTGKEQIRLPWNIPKL